MDTHSYNNNWCYLHQYAQIEYSQHSQIASFCPNYSHVNTLTGKIGINRQISSFSLTTKKALMKIRPYNQNMLALNCP